MGKELRKVDISFIIPCYGSEDTLCGVCDEIRQKMSERSEKKYEIITVNDCSPDNVWNVMLEMSEERPEVKCINLAKNGGKHAAVMAGLNWASGEYIVLLDDDGQCPLDRLWDLLEPLKNDWDIAIAKYKEKKESRFKRFGSMLNNIMSIHMINKPKDLQLSNFLAFKRFVADEVIKYTSAFPYIDGLLLRTSSKICNVPMEQRERAAGVGNYTLKKSLALFLNGFTAFSVKPLRVADIIGAVSAAGGFLYALAIIIRKLVTPEIAVGYSSLMAVILIIGGIIMLLLGLIGEYVGRIYICLNNSPQYVIREKINIDPDVNNNERS